MGVAACAAGYSQEELEAVQARHGLRFPPDLVAFLRERRPASGFDWRCDTTAIRRALAWPLEGIIFDVENKGFWREHWGTKPATAKARAEIAAAAVAAAPRLIPVYSHRYIPETPSEAGNPVFSVYQTNIIVYGDTLERYISNEFGFGGFVPSVGTKYIPFWSDLAGWEN